jgi:hypothetical protein
MAISEEIGQEKQRISQRLMRLDAERTLLSDQLNELEIAERALRRFEGKAPERLRRGGAARPASTVGEKRGARRGQQAPNLSLRDASLKAVQAHSNGARADELLNYLLREFGLTVRPNHLGSTLHGHRRAGRLEYRDQRWYLPPLA